MNIKTPKYTYLLPPNCLCIQAQSSKHLSVQLCYYTISKAAKHEDISSTKFVHVCGYQIC